jgi:hypothetical protein
MADLETIGRKTHKIAKIWAIICFCVMVVAGVITDHFKQSTANQERQQHSQRDSLMFGRLHVKYAPDKETPWVDIATDRDTLKAWRRVFVGPEGPQTKADIARDYGNLVSTGKLTSVEPDTLVHILQRENEYDCLVSIVAGKNATQSGWVDCRWITAAN